MFAKIRKDIIGIPDGESIRSILKKKGILSTFIGLVTVSLALFHIITSYIGQLEAFRHRATHLLVILFLVFELHRKACKIGRKVEKKQVPHIPGRSFCTYGHR